MSASPAAAGSTSCSRSTSPSSTRVGMGSAAPASAYIATKLGMTKMNSTARITTSAISRKIG
jgi:hypothetical protein